MDSIKCLCFFVFSRYTMFEYEYVKTKKEIAVYEISYDKQELCSVIN